MTTPDREDLLWRLGLDAGAAVAGGEVPDDALLTAYRRGELDPAVARRVDEVLAASPAARRRLAELAGRPPEQPPARVRESFLEAFAAAGEGRGRAAGAEASAAGRPPRPELPSGRRPTWSRRRWIPLAAAAVLAVAAGLAVRQQLATPPLPPDLAYQVTATGLATVRGEETAAGPVEALPDTVLRIAASPLSGAVEGVEVGLYRRRGHARERVDPAPGLRRTADRGEVRFEARAADLLGGGPGAHDLYVVAARRGDLAPEYPLGPGGDPLQLLERGGSRLAYRLSVVLRSQPVTPPPGTTEDP